MRLVFFVVLLLLAESSGVLMVLLGHLAHIHAAVCYGYLVLLACVLARAARYIIKIINGPRGGGLRRFLRRVLKRMIRFGLKAPMRIRACGGRCLAFLAKMLDALIGWIRAAARAVGRCFRKEQNPAAKQPAHEPPIVRGPDAKERQATHGDQGKGGMDEGR